MGRVGFVVALVLASWLAFHSSQLPKEPRAVRGLVPVVAYDDLRQRIVLYEESHALLIGCSQYKSGWEPLPGVLDDMGAVSTLLARHGFSITTVYDPNRETMDKAIREFIGRYGGRTEARLLFYYAGHGYTEPSGTRMSYLVPVDAPNPRTDPGGFRERAFPLEFFVVYSKSFEAKHAFFIFDSCFAGTIFDRTREATKESISYSASLPVRQFVTSGGADEVVSDSGTFRGALVRGLLGEADKDGDGYITGSQLGEYLFDQVSNHPGSRQHPQYGKLSDHGFNKGDTVFVIPQGDDPQTRHPRPEVRLLAGPIEGTYRHIAEDIRLACQAVARINPVMTPGSIYNLTTLLDAGDPYTLGMTQDDSIDELADARTRNLKLVMPLYRAEMHLLTRADAPIHKLEDLSGRKVATGPVGSGTRATAQRIKTLTGIRWEDVPYYPKDIYPDLRDRKIDAIFFVGGAPISFYADFPQSMEQFVKLVPIEHSSMTGRYERCVIRASDYKWLKQDVATYGVTAYLVAAKNVPDGILGDIAGAILDHMEALRFQRPIWNRVMPAAYGSTKVKMPERIREQIRSRTGPGT